jgi:hypothetical protein
MFTDPFSVTYDGSTYSLPRTGMSRQNSYYRTADGTLMLSIRSSDGREGSARTVIELARRIPDPTPGDVFNPYREIINAFSIGYRFDSITRAGVSDIPLLRTALLNTVTSVLQDRLIGGEK